MRYYFLLQFRILNRRIRAFGLAPWAAYALSIIIAGLLARMLFLKTEYAAFLLAFLPLSFLLQFSESQRNVFLRTIFSRIQYRKIRITENVILVLPFALYLIFRGEILLSGGLMALASLLAFVRFGWSQSRTLPTPFGRHPFEFPAGFRKMIWVFPLILLLLYKAIEVGNFNLGMGSLVLVFLVCFSFFTRTEQLYYTWIFNHRPLFFLWYKIRVALLFSTLLSLPVFLGLVWFFPEKWWIVLLFQALGYLYLTTIILAKYSAFPGAISLPQGILIAFSLWFPPLLLAIIPYFYQQALKKLKPVLT